MKILKLIVISFYHKKKLNFLEYDSENLEIFSQQINALEKKNLIDLKKIMITYKDLYNVIKAFGYNNLLGRIKIDRVSKMVHEVERRIDIINLTNTPSLNKVKQIKVLKEN